MLMRKKVGKNRLLKLKFETKNGTSSILFFFIGKEMINMVNFPAPYSKNK